MGGGQGIFELDYDQRFPTEIAEKGKSESLDGMPGNKQDASRLPHGF